ncbi:putative integral membrane protein [Aspergillus saccharolyticus JOP 1030-1]|uniref:Rhodopsin domain-containing protein n=1 Tax=Aspergillus saccharolyticus JOP 1030-1 TaxID=1450539 RepID=A0A318ZSW4_9EURO|nr:hypothetical protein BP01DRAFT_387887 [Aspergillus saccharolyticus JOP 1030-1]PYH49734.1 hypothetical protein BP01DRAFT_387887 [Aspergillus saccharolyticus JOP 1030-1]
MAADDRSLEVKAVAAVFMSVACIAVILRCYVRGWIVRAFGIDDWAMVVAMLFYCMFSGCMIGGSLNGTGKHFNVLNAHQRVTAMKYWWFCEIAYCFSAMGCKISVCIFLLRITVRRLHIWILRIVMVLTVVAALVFMFLMLLQCRPVSYFWTRKAFDDSIHGECINMEIIIAMTYVYSAFAALCDFTVGILPIFIVKNLHMRKQTKMAVVGILGMACIASSATIIRIPWVHTFSDPDFLYATVEIALWSNIETGLGITAGSLATLRPLVRHWLGSHSDPNYYGRSPFGGPSGSRRMGGGASHNHARSHDRPVPLGSLDDTAVQGRLRPDKLAVTVTTIHSQRGPMNSSSNSSEEQLTAGLSDSGSKDSRGSRRGEPDSKGSAGGYRGGGFGGIQRTFEVTQTSSAGDSSCHEHSMV